MPVKLINIASIAPNSTGTLVVVPTGPTTSVMTLIGNTQRVGIGTATPAAALDVAASGTTEPPLRLTNALATRNNAHIEFFGRQANSVLWRVGPDPFNNGGQDFTIARLGLGNPLSIAFTTGNVGVNSSNSPYKFDVAGDININDPAGSGGRAFRINGIPLATLNANGTEINLANVATINGSAPGGGAVASVFGRTGAVTAANGDYTAAQVTNAVSELGSYANPSWITSLAWSKITGAPATLVNTVFGRSGTVTATAGDYNATQVSLSPQVSTWLTVQEAIAGLTTLFNGIVSSQWVTGGSNAIYYTAGNVGIGVTSPGYPLSVINSTEVRRHSNDDLGPLAYFWKTRGTAPIGTDIQTGDMMLYFGWGGRVTGFNANQGAIVARAGTNTRASDLIFMLNDGTDNAAFGNGYERLRITSAGNVGIGVNNPAARLTVVPPASYDPSLTVGAASAFSIGTAGGIELAMSQAASAGAYWLQARFGGSGSVLSLNPLGGNVGIGTNNPGRTLAVAGDIVTYRGASEGVMFLGSDLSHYLLWSPGGYSMPGGDLTVNGVLVPSDARLKERIEPVTGDPLAVLQALNFVRYEHNGLGGTVKGTRGIGLIAQEVQEVLPEAVHGDETLSINYQPLYIHALRGIVDLAARIKRLEDRAGIQLEGS